MSSGVTCRRRSDCRLCGSAHLTRVLSLTPTPPANAFVSESERHDSQEAFPLDVYFCETCAHVQLCDVVDPELLFRDYVYVSGTSSMFVEHFRRYAEFVIDRVSLTPDSLVVDIGSNDGTLLSFFQERQMRVLGVDPALDIARAATARGIETVPSFLTSTLASDIRASHGHAQVVCANNVFAHSDDLSGMLSAIRELLDKDGVFVFEVSYLVDVYEKTLFDTIYHEHVAYHSVKPLSRFFEAHGLQLIDALRVDSHGGSLRGVAQLAGGPYSLSSSVRELEQLEADLAIDKAATWIDFASHIDRQKAALSGLLSDLRAAGKSIVGYGAPAKATTLMHHFELGPDSLEFVVDDSELKQGLYTPGYHIHVVPPSLLYKRMPDYVLILAWNFAAPIMKNHARFKQNGGQFIVPLPEVLVC